MRKAFLYQKIKCITFFFFYYNNVVHYISANITFNLNVKCIYLKLKSSVRILDLCNNRL